MVTVDVWCDVLVWAGVCGVACLPLHLLLHTSSSTLLFLSLWLLLATLCFIRPTFKISPAGKAVLITGCDSGFGFDLALRLDSLGFRVIAGCLNESSENAKTLRASASPRLTTIQLDVTEKDQIKEAVEKVKKLIPEGEVLWSLVNNAGISTFGGVEWVTEDTYRKIFEVNVLGTVAVTKSFLPLIRKAKGRVVNVASMLGRMGMAMRSPYCLTKYAVEGFTDCLRHEMRTWGVDVILLEPGNYVAATSIFTDESVRRQGESMWEAMGEDVRRDYTREYFDAAVNTMLSYTNCGITDTSDVINAFTDALTHTFPRTRYLPMDAKTRVRIAVATHFPAWVYDYFYASTHR